MELSKIINDIAPTLTGINREFIEAKKGIRIDKMPEEELKKQLIILIGKTHLQVGQIVDANLLKLTIEELINDIKKYFGFFSFDQINHAFKLGTMGYFGEWFGLNNTSYLKWVKSYLENNNRLEAFKMQNRYTAELSNDNNENQKKDFNEDEKNKKAYEFILNYYKKERKTPFIADWRSCFEHLENTGEIKDTNEEKILFMENVIAEIREDIFSTSKSKMEREERLNQWTNLKIKDECRKKRCIIYFENLKQS